MSWFINHRPGATIERHSLSHALAGVPAPSEREPGRAAPLIVPPGNRKGCGRFSSPLRNSKEFTFYHPTDDTPSASHSLDSSLREGAGRGCITHRTARKAQRCGRFSSPLRDSECFTFLLQAVLCYYNSADSRGGNLRNKCFYDLFNLHRRLRSLSTLSAFWASWRIAILSPSTMADCRLSTAADKSKSISASASLLTGSL